MRFSKVLIILKKNWIILTILLVGGVIRFFYAYAPFSPISPDESTYGLAALHWMKGTDFPIFYYAQPYTGTLSAIISAFLMKLFGVSVFWLKIVPLLCSIVFIYTNYLLGKKLFKKESAGFFSALLTALASPFLLNWSGRAGSGYPEMILIGNLSLLLVLKILYPEVQEAPPQGRASFGDRILSVRYKNYAILGFLLGVGFWVQPSIVYYAVPILLLLLLFKPWLFFTLPGWLLVAGSLVGGFPVVYYNIINHGATSSALFHDPWGIKNAAASFWSIGFPIVTGLRASWSIADFFKPLSIFIYLFYFAVAYWSLSQLFIKLIWEGSIGWVFSFLKKTIQSLVGLLRLGFEGSRTGLKGVSWSQELARIIDPIWLIWSVLFFTWLIFSFSGQYGQFIIEPRYILSLYTALPLLVGGFIACAPIPFPALRYSFLIVILISQMIGIFIGGKNTHPSTFLEQYTLSPLIEYLESKQLHFVYSDEEICHRLIFESNESIICTTITEGFTANRYPAYKGVVANADKKNLAYARAPGRTYHTQECLDDLTLQTDPCHFELVGEFGVYFY